MQKVDFISSVISTYLYVYVADGGYRRKQYMKFDINPISFAIHRFCTGRNLITVQLDTMREQAEQEKENEI